MAQRPSFAQLERAVLSIVCLIGNTPGLENTRLVVAGDMAVCKYLPRLDQITVSQHISSLQQRLDSLWR